MHALCTNALQSTALRTVSSYSGVLKGGPEDSDVLVKLDVPKNSFALRAPSTSIHTSYPSPTLTLSRIPWDEKLPPAQTFPEFFFWVSSFLP